MELNETDKKAKSKCPLPMTKCGFAGTLLINGQPWQELVLQKGTSILYYA